MANRRRIKQEIEYLKELSKLIKKEMGSGSDCPLQLDLHYARGILRWVLDTRRENRMTSPSNSMVKTILEMWNEEGEDDELPQSMVAFQAKMEAIARGDGWEPDFN